MADEALNELFERTIDEVAAATGEAEKRSTLSESVEQMLQFAEPGADTAMMRAMWSVMIWELAQLKNSRRK